MSVLRLLRRLLTDLAASLASLVTVALFVNAFLLAPCRIPTGSMVPTLLVGDVLLVNQQVFAPAGHWAWLLPYRAPRAGEPVVFHWPVRPDELLVKRCVALPGQRVSLHGGRLLVDGTPVQEPWAVFTQQAGPQHFRDEFPSLLEADPDVQAPWWAQLRRCCAQGSYVVPAGQLFVLGDNRNNSVDSRFWGPVPQQDLVGMPLVIYVSIDPATGRVRPRRWQMVR